MAGQMMSRPHDLGSRGVCGLSKPGPSDASIFAPSPEVSAKLSSTCVESALALNEFGKGLGIGLLGLDVSKDPRPFASGALVDFGRIARAQYYGGEWLIHG